ncbi:hypothetical protein C4587_00415 [Candidatus Parcubacteria bacterium]|nr:MAG: hypothetical protein C4587_00415 [Candidatus Parcubacteria bacterium]
MQRENRQCANCGNQFVVEPEDFAFYEKIGVPPPTWCPECRLVRRLMWRNERSLYRRKCDLCGIEKIMMFAPESPYKAYCFQCWWSDKWDATKFEREYDFKKSFFEQLGDLIRDVPRPGIIQQGLNVNSEYTNRVSDLRNCYLIFGSMSDENCLYGSWINYSKECIDAYNVQKSEKCYECVDCSNCYNLRYSRESVGCSNSAFLLNCRNCESCFGCVNLRSKNYCIFNQQYSKEEYQKRIQQFNLGNAIVVEGVRSKFNTHAEKFIVPAYMQHHSTNFSGNWLEECKNVKSSFSCLKVEDGRYLFAIADAKDVADYCFWGAASELIYESVNDGRQCSNLSFSNECWDQMIDGAYVMNCHNSRNLFGCVGLRNKQYCIFNKQYSKTEYETLLPKVIAHAKENPFADKKERSYGFGEFFPADFSPFAYNETIAQEHFPLSKEDILERGFTWKDPEEKNYKATTRGDALPDDIRDASDGITSEVIACVHEGRCNDQCTAAFRIIPAELQIYRAMNIPLPRLCPNCRHHARLKQRNPMRLSHKKCQCAGAASENGLYKNDSEHFHGSKYCPNEFETSHISNTVTIYCEPCYQAEVV